MKKKHGQESYIIFRLLLKQGGPVETDEVSNFLCWGNCTLLYVLRRTLYASMMHWSSLRWCVHFFLLFTLLQTSVHDARLPLKFADYWQDNSRQADCSWNFIQTLEGWIHRFGGLLHKLYTSSISCLDKLCLPPSFSQYFCPFTLELLLQNSFQLKKITVTYCNAFALYPYFNDVKGVGWFSMSFNRAYLGISC